MKLFIAMDNFCNDGLLMSVSQEGGFRCDIVITEFIPTNINCYACLTLELYRKMGIHETLWRLFLE